jgi:hypothetical protein
MDAKCAGGEMTNPGDDHTVMFFLNEGTGDPGEQQRMRIIPVTFGKYTVSVVVNEDYRFMGIAAVSVDEDFLSLQQRRRLGGVHDVAWYYEDEG